MKSVLCNNYSVAVTGCLGVLSGTIQVFTWTVPVRNPAGSSDIPIENVYGFLQYYPFPVKIISLNKPLRLPSKLLGQSRNYSCA